MIFLIAMSVAIAVGASTPSDDRADAIFFNGNVITVDREFSLQRAFAVRGDRFMAVGTDAQVRKLAGPRTHFTDLAGATVVPGLADSHDHLFAVERTERGLDLIDVASREEMLRQVAEGLKKAAPGEVVFGRVSLHAPLTRADLDTLSTTHPIVLMRLRRGYALMNGVALRQVGITREHPSFMGLPAPVDAAGDPTGEMPQSPAGLYAVDQVLKAMTPQEEEDAVVRGQRMRNALGITSIRDLSNLPAWARVYWRMRRDNKLTVRVSVGLSLPGSGDPASLLRDLPAGPGFGDHWLRLDSAGEDFLPPPWALAPLTEFVREVNRLGWRLSPHVITGDIDKILEAYEAADHDDPIGQKRWIVEHVNSIMPAQMDRCARLGVIVSIQAYGGLFGPVSPQDAARMWPVRELLQHGITVISGSDTIGRAGGAMSPSSNPFVTMYYYITGSRDGVAVAPDETVSRADALRFATINNAFATFEDDVKGSIERGKLADFVVLSDDFLSVPADDILKLHALATYVGGRKVYAAKPGQF